jgi:hypothetical protein
VKVKVRPKAKSGLNGKPVDPDAKEVTLDRQEFLSKLKELEPGLTSNPFLEQSDCFAIPGDGTICTFNEQEACRVPAGLPKRFRGAIPAKKLLSFLGMMDGKKVKVAMTESEFSVIGKDDVADFKIVKDVKLPIDKVETPDPKSWKPLHPEFQEAITIVQECASTSEKLGNFFRIHVTPKYIEASDKEFQVIRYRLKTGFERPILVRRDSIKHVTQHNLTSFAETDGWVHFKGPTGLVFSCRRFVEAYVTDPEYLERVLKTTGDKAELPKALIGSLKRAELFSKDDEDANFVQVKILPPGKITVRAAGLAGKYLAKKFMKYNGQPVGFIIAPTLLQEIVKRQTECEIDKRNLRIKVEADKWTYVASLEKLEKDDGK